MEIRIVMSDEAWKRLCSEGGSMRGALRMVDDQKVMFTDYRRRPRPAQRLYRRLPHGRVTVTDIGVRASFAIRFDEQTAGKAPADHISWEALDASRYIAEMLKEKAERERQKRNEEEIRPFC